MVSRTQIITADQIIWGSTTYEDSTYDYVFGYLPSANNGRQAYVYRVPRGRLDSSPEYLAGNAWSGQRSQATPL